LVALPSFVVVAKDAVQELAGHPPVVERSHAVGALDPAHIEPLRAAVERAGHRAEVREPPPEPELANPVAPLPLLSLLVPTLPSRSDELGPKAGVPPEQAASHTKGAATPKANHEHIFDFLWTSRRDPLSTIRA
jgi:hypothetical protein